MSRTRRVVGIVVGVFLLLSAVAHSLLGGEALRAELTAAQVPPDLLRGALIGWYFGGAAMLALRWCRRASSRPPTCCSELRPWLGPASTRSSSFS